MENTRLRFNTPDTFNERIARANYNTFNRPDDRFARPNAVSRLKSGRDFYTRSHTAAPASKSFKTRLATKFRQQMIATVIISLALIALLSVQSSFTPALKSSINNNLKYSADYMQLLNSIGMSLNNFKNNYLTFTPTTQDNSVANPLPEPAPAPVTESINQAEPTQNATDVGL
ncbi:MAG: hypothetical protein LBM38_00310 [Clostridiales bacterium]|jgi:hypothetical protein|nr:hypothetical protein [Clostridiales bacterium]